MDELLTTKQVQDILQVDRTTIYRMLNDGRLVGIKIGQQWRFSRQEVESLLSGNHTVEEKDHLPMQALPIHCIQAIQDVFSEVAEIGSVITSAEGEALTHVSNMSGFCQLIQNSPSGRLACRKSWQRLAEEAEKTPTFFTCHAGLQYARAQIEINGQLGAMLIAGQFYANPPAADDQADLLQRLAAKHQIDIEALSKAAEKISILDARKRSQISAWLERVAHTFEDIGRERSALLGRLSKIAAMSTLETQ